MLMGGLNKCMGIIPPHMSTKYSLFLTELKRRLGPNKLVGADISLWGLGKGEYILAFWPWINATILNQGGFDYINTMSYHWSRFGSLWAWKKDGFFIDQWGIDKKRVRIGLPYYSSSMWKKKRCLQSCPNITYNQTICNGKVFVSQKMNYELGRWILKEGFGGAFPWAADYDLNYNLIPWLVKGLGHL